MKNLFIPLYSSEPFTDFKAEIMPLENSLAQGYSYIRNTSKS